MQPRTSFIHAHHDVAEPSADGGRSGSAGIGGASGSALLAEIPRSSPEVMESIAVALLALTVPGVCLRAGRSIGPEPSGAPYGAVEAGHDVTD
ncbi:hypothetical protein ACFRAR_24040 [Kitasatospora sp. NPDC056651]|uniref:hypothetical protein n=1 Tax=Kitasatospora sp. NPDC056651 TaxID=3345892 RepID=UPI0036762399